MPSLNLANWLGTSQPSFKLSIDHRFRAGRNWFLIQRNPTAIEVFRGGTQLPAQQVSIVYPDADEVQTDVGAQLESLNVIVYGVKDHCAIADTDLEVGDRFMYKDRSYEITAITPTPGGFEAHGIAQ